MSMSNSRWQGVLSEIEEESEPELFEITAGAETDGSLFSYDVIHNGYEYGTEDVVYVAVFGKNAEDSSNDALVWTLNHVVRSTTTVNLIHIYPEVHYIPSPLGKLAVSQVNKEQKNNYLSEERIKRNQYLQKFLNLCSSSKIKVETILIESDTEAKAIVELITILNIKSLVVGTTKSTLRRLKAGRGSGIAEQIQKSAPDFCQIKMICEGKQVSKEELDMYFNNKSGSDALESVDSSINGGIILQQQADEVDHTAVKEKNLVDSFSCAGCFKPQVTP